MKKTLLFFLMITATTSCSQDPILSDLTNTRMTLLFKGTYESNDPYEWNTNVYNDNSISSLSGDLGNDIPFTDVGMFLDIADIRLAVGTGKPDDVAPENYWTYFTKNRNLFCSNNKPNGYDLITCVKEKGDEDFADFFSGGFSYPATDVPENTYNHLAIFFRKFVTSPSYEYDSNNLNFATAQTTFDNRTIDGLNLMESIIQYAESDTSQTTSLMFPMERTDLSLTIPPGNDPYVLEVRIFIKNLLMKHYIQDGSGLSLINSGDQVTFIGPSDWNYNHNTSDPDLALQMGGNIIFTARIYDPAAVGSLEISDPESIPSFKSYYAVVGAGSTFGEATADPAIFTTYDLPFAATSRRETTDINKNGTTENGLIDNLPAGSYDLYKTCDIKMMESTGLVDGEDGFPETAVLCSQNITITAGSVTTPPDALTCQCP